MKKKLWIVKREVLATTVEKAIHASRGRIYGVEEADEKYQPQESGKKIGFKKKS